MSLASIVRVIGGDLYAGGRRASVPGPGHGRWDRSVSLLLVGDRVVINTFAGEDWRAVADHLRRLGLIGPMGHLLDARSVAALPEIERPSLRSRVACAHQLWEDSLPLPGTLSERHCRRRGIAGPLSPALRHHPAAPAAVYGDAGVRRPALVAAIQTPGGELCGVEVTYLAPNGDRARMGLPRKTIGACPAGAAVRLDPCGPRMLVGEGVFTTLSAGRRFRRPAWALLSVRNLVRWRPPAGVVDVLVAGDRGPVGEAGMEALVGELKLGGLAAAGRLPPAPFADWNDADRAEGLEGEKGRGRAGAADGWSGPSAEE
jgi:putative DNA primase/helicase